MSQDQSLAADHHQACDGRKAVLAGCVLKISRKTLWERRKDKSLGFPRPVQLGGARNLYRASAIRNWAEAMAQEEG